MFSSNARSRSSTRLSATMKTVATPFNIMRTGSRTVLSNTGSTSSGWMAWQAKAFESGSHSNPALACGDIATFSARNRFFNNNIMKTKRTLMTLVAVLTAVRSVVSAEQPELKFENEPGWIWHAKPDAAGWESTVRRGLVMRLDELKEDKLLLSVAQSVEASRDTVRFRPVAFDAA